MPEGKGVPVFLIFVILGFAGLFFIGRGCDAIKREWEKTEKEAKEQKSLADEKMKAQQAEQARQEQAAAVVEREKLAEQQKQKELEAKRTPEEWAELALKTLGDNSKSLEIRACDALRSVDRIPKEKRSATIVWKAINAANAAEQAVLVSQRKTFEASRTVVCNDGSSSSCLCNGSRRGCCSHHGGISGCEPYPTKILCSK